MTKDVFSILFISFVTIHVKAFRVAAFNYDVGLILDTSGDEVLEDAKYKILSNGPSQELNYGISSKRPRKTDNRTYVSTAKLEDAKPVTLIQTIMESSPDYQPNSEFISIQFDSNNKWWVFYCNKNKKRSSVRVSDDANQPGDLFTIKKVTGESVYHICFDDRPLGIGYHGHVMVLSGNDTLLQVKFEKVKV